MLSLFTKEKTLVNIVIHLIPEDLEIFVIYFLMSIASGGLFGGLIGVRRLGRSILVAINHWLPRSLLIPGRLNVGTILGICHIGRIGLASVLGLELIYFICDPL